MFEENNKVKRLFQKECGRFSYYFRIANDIRKCGTETPPRRIAAENVIVYIAQRRNVHELRFRYGQLKYRMECLQDISVAVRGFLRGKQLAVGPNSNGHPSATSSPTGLQKNLDEIAQDIRALQAEIDGESKQIWKSLAAVELDEEPLLINGLSALAKPKSAPKFQTRARRIIYQAFGFCPKTATPLELAICIDGRPDGASEMGYWKKGERKVLSVEIKDPLNAALLLRYQKDVAAVRKRIS